MNRRSFAKRGLIFLPSIIVAKKTLAQFIPMPGASVMWKRPTAVGNGLLNGLVAVWEMESFSGTDQLDFTGNGHLMSHTGNPLRSSTHIQGSFSAEGTVNASYYTNTDGVFVNTNSFTFYSWVNDQSGGFGSGFMGDRWNTDHAWAVFLSGSVLALAIRNAADNANFVATSGVTATGSAWHMLVVTYNSSTKVGQFSVDGENFISTGVTDGMRTTVDGLRLCNNMGLTDETAYWNVILTQQQVSTLYNSGAGFFFSGGGWTT